MKKYTFTLQSNSMGGVISEKEAYTASGGKNISPHLEWINAPAETKCFAITMYDKDAPTTSGFWHWIVVNIPKTVTELSENAGNPDTHLMPAGAIQCKTDYGTIGYGGPHPPIGHGWHMYTLTVYALNAPIELDENTPAAQIGFQLWAKTIEKASIVAYYQR